MVDAKGIIHELNQPVWKTEVKPKRTNREEFLDGWSNKKLAFVINSMTNSGYECEMFCPLCHIENSPCDGSGCVEKISKWLGEKAQNGK